MANEITIDGKHRVQTKKLDAIVATLCFVYGDKSPQRDELIRSEIAKYVIPWAYKTLSESSFYERLQGEKALKEAFEVKLMKAFTKRYHAMGYMERP